MEVGKFYPGSHFPLCAGLTECKSQRFPVYAGFISQSVSVHSNADWYFILRGELKKEKAFERQRKRKREKEKQIGKGRNRERGIQREREGK